MTGYRVSFERVGRKHDVPDLSVSGDADKIAEQIYRYARGYLASRDYVVHVNLENGTGSLGFGRFGSFTLTPMDGAKAGAK